MLAAATFSELRSPNLQIVLGSIARVTQAVGPQEFTRLLDEVVAETGVEVGWLVNEWGMN